MTLYGEYLVTGKREYRGHKPGTTFEAALDNGAAARAIARGDIRLIRDITPDLAPGTYVLPDPCPPGRPSSPAAAIEVPDGASLIEGGGG